METHQVVMLAVFIFLIGGFLFARLKYGSWSGAFLGGSVERTFGEVLLKRGFANSQVVQVVGLSGSGEDFVGLVFTSKAALGANMTPYRLSKAQAKQLADLLVLAAK